MVYETLQDYLYDQFYLPIKDAIEKGNKKKAMELVEFICFKHIESNAFSKGYEDYINEKYGDKFEIPIITFLDKYVHKYMKMKSWDECTAVYSEHLLKK